MIGLDDGKVVANIVSAGGAAATPGMTVGDIILEWNNVPIATALANVSTLWSPSSHSLATNEHTLLEKYRALVLDPLTTASIVKFSKPDGTGVTTAALTAVYDSFSTYQSTKLWSKVDPANLITYKELAADTVTLW